MIQILLVDDHAVVRSAIRKLLASAANISVVGEVNGGEAAVNFVKKQAVDIVLLDIQMPGITGLETTRRLLATHPRIKIVVLSSIDIGPLPYHLVCAGIKGYLTKGCSFDEMVTAIQKVHAGATYFESAISEQLTHAEQTKKTDSAAFLSLSKREMEFVLLFAKSMRSKDMADQLGLSQKTMGTYRSRLFKKLGVTSYNDLIVLMLEHHLLDKDWVSEPLD